MDAVVENQIKNLWTSDRQAQNDAFFATIALTDVPVSWAYEVWDEMLANLSH
jgi:hypothetical protein